MAKSAAERFEEVVKALIKKPGVTPPAGGKSFGSNALKVRGKIFAFVSSKDRFVVKLSKERVAELMATKTGKPFDLGHGRLMKEWLEVDEKTKVDWIALAKEAMDFVSKPAKKKK